MALECEVSKAHLTSLCRANQSHPTTINICAVANQKSTKMAWLPTSSNWAVPTKQGAIFALFAQRQRELGLLERPGSLSALGEGFGARGHRLGQSDAVPWWLIFVKHDEFCGLCFCCPFFGIWFLGYLAVTKNELGCWIFGLKKIQLRIWNSFVIDMFFHLHPSGSVVVFFFFFFAFIVSQKCLGSQVEPLKLNCKGCEQIMNTFPQLGERCWGSIFGPEWNKSSRLGCCLRKVEKLTEEQALLGWLPTVWTHPWQYVLSSSDTNYSSRSFDTTRPVPIWEDLALNLGLGQIYGSQMQNKQPRHRVLLENIGVTKMTWSSDKRLIDSRNLTVSPPASCCFQDALLAKKSYLRGRSDEALGDELNKLQSLSYEYPWQKKTSFVGICWSLFCWGFDLEYIIRSVYYTIHFVLICFNDLLQHAATIFSSCCV